jgi:hypothetical protein
VHLFCKQKVPGSIPGVGKKQVFFIFPGNKKQNATLQRAEKKCGTDIVTDEDIDDLENCIGIEFPDSKTSLCSTCESASTLRQHSNFVNFTRDPVEILYGRKGTRGQIEQTWQDLTDVCGLQRPTITTSELKLGDMINTDQDIQGYVKVILSSLQSRYKNKILECVAPYLNAFVEILKLYKDFQQLIANTELSDDRKSEIAKLKILNILKFHNIKCSSIHYPFSILPSLDILISLWQKSVIMSTTRARIIKTDC